MNAEKVTYTNIGLSRNYIIAALLFIVALIYLLPADSKAQNVYGKEILRARQIVVISSQLIWNAYQSPDTFKIAVYGAGAEELNPLKSIAASKDFNGRKIVVYHYKRVKDIKPTDVLFVNNHYNEELSQILDVCRKQKIVLIADRATNENLYMINLSFQGSEKQFSVNNKNTAFTNAVIPEKIVKQEGTIIDKRNIYAKKEQKLKDKQIELDSLSKEIDIQQTNLDKEIKTNKAITDKYAKLENDLQIKQHEIDVQKAAAALLLDEVTHQEYQLKRNKILLGEQEKEIKKKQEQILVANEELKRQETELMRREQTLQKQEDEMKNCNTQISHQRSIIAGVAGFSIIVIILVFVILKSLSDRKRANLALKKKNIEINKQKLEIDSQASQLEEVNVELEKLSIVAGKTQNAVVIMDRNGYFEWVNAGFTRLYGYTLQLLRNERDENIVNVSTHKSIRNLLYKCVSSKQTIIYESLSKTRYGKDVWCQTTLTPILDSKNEVSQLVAIYTDINKLKEQENAIKNQNEELSQQTAELEIQKDKITEQNRHIKDSILYAQTIQKTILPPKELIDKYFDSFILYKPKDIVSGDFYWFAEVQDGDHFYKFIGAFDCTGHGVPGAFMSLIGNRLLHDIVIVKKQYSPRDVMDLLNKNVIKALKQDQSSNNDGMDTCFCRIEQTGDDDHMITFCGAKRPLFFFSKDSQEIQILKGDRKSIGGVRLKRSTAEFTNQQLVLHSGDTIYLSSDGIIDQNDKDRKRFGSDNFIEMMNRIHNLPMNEQAGMIEQTLDAYMNGEEQRDDISVIGIKFK